LEDVFVKIDYLQSGLFRIFFRPPKLLPSYKT
jgi:hypothetical protein